jgi:hypothetical protein
VNPDGTISIWTVTSTVSSGGDRGADPNKLVEITDDLSATSLPAGESFQTVRTGCSANGTAAPRSRLARSNSGA